MSQQNTRGVWYEPHPVTFERKALIRALGFVILDAEFKPSGHQNPDVPELRPEPATTTGDRLDRPSVEEYVLAGYLAQSYPPEGYASRSTEQEIQAAIDAQRPPADASDANAPALPNLATGEFNSMATADVAALTSAQVAALSSDSLKPSGTDGGADANGDGKVTAAELKAALIAKGIAFKGNASKTELQALLDAALPTGA